MGRLMKRACSFLQRSTENLTNQNPYFGTRSRDIAEAVKQATVLVLPGDNNMESEFFRVATRTADRHC